MTLPRWAAAAWVAWAAWAAWTCDVRARGAARRPGALSSRHASKKGLPRQSPFFWLIADLRGAACSRSSTRRVDAGGVWHRIESLRPTPPMDQSRPATWCGARRRPDGIGARHVPVREEGVSVAGIAARTRACQAPRSAAHGGTARLQRSTPALLVAELRRELAKNLFLSAWQGWILRLRAG